MPIGRKADLFLLWLAVNIRGLAVLFVHAYYREQNDAPFLNERVSTVNEYERMDLCVFADAQYTRNPTIADFSAAFQDHPVSLEHFLSGSIISPPAQLKSYRPGKR